jgi:hypothetical protein
MHRFVERQIEAQDIDARFAQNAAHRCLDAGAHQRFEARLRDVAGRCHAGICQKAASGLIWGSSPEAEVVTNAGGMAW